MEALADADLVLVVLDAGAGLSEVDRELLADVADRAAIVVLNKADLGGAVKRAEPDRGDGGAAGGSHLRADRRRALPSCAAEILRTVRGSAAEDGGAMLTNLRQQGQVQAALAALSRRGCSVRNGIPHEMVLLDLYNALRALDELTGATTADDILNLIFSTFCIGK